MSDNRDNKLAELLSSPEGRQWLAHCMVGGTKETFVYRPPQPGDESAAVARYYRSMAADQPTGTRQFIERLADSWDAYARKERRWGRVLRWLGLL